MPLDRFDQTLHEQELEEARQAELNQTIDERQQYAEMVGDTAPTPSVPQQEVKQPKAGEVVPQPEQPKQPAEQQTYNPLGFIPGLPEQVQGLVNQFSENLYANPITAVQAEVGSTLVDAAAGTVESVVDTADLLGDLTRLGVNKALGKETEAKDDPFSDRYIAAATDLGLAKPKTAVGQFASKLLQFAVLTRTAATKLPKILVTLGTKGGLKGAIASGLVPGALADFILTDKDDGNLSSMANNLMPEDSPLRDSFIFALRSDANDDVFTAKLKATIEGGAIGTAADSLLWLMWGRKAAQRALKEGATPEEAMATGLKEADAKMKEIDGADAKFQEQESVRFAERQSEELQELISIRSRHEAELEALKARGISESDEAYTRVLENYKMVNENIQEVSEKLTAGYTPTDVTARRSQDLASTYKPADPNLAIEQQISKEVKPPRAVKGGDPQPYVKPDDSGAYQMMTDAQHGIQGHSEAQVDIIMKFTNRLELQQMASKLRRPIGDILTNAGRSLDDFRSALAQDPPVEKMEDLMEQFGLLNPKTVRGSKLLSKEGILVTKALIGETADDIHRLAGQAIELREAGEPVGNQLDRMIDRLVSLLEFHKTTSYETASTLQMFKNKIGDFVTGSNSDIALSRKEIKDWAYNLKAAIREGRSGDDEVKRLVNAMVLAGGDPSRQIQFAYAAAKLGSRNLTDGLYQSILSGPATHLRNAVGNSYSLFERPLSAYLRGARLGDKQMMDSAVSGASAMFGGLHDAFKIAKTTYKRGVSANFNSRFALEDFEAKAMLEQLEKGANTKGQKIAAGWIKAHYKFLHNPWLSWPSNALMAADDFFKSLAARYRIHSKAKYAAYQAAENPDDVKFLNDQFIKEFSKGIDPATGRILDKDILDYAERMTFQQDPGSFVNNVSLLVDSIPFGMGRLFLPFVRTPGNLFGYGLEHLPIANQLTRRFDDTYKAAKKNGDAMLMAEMEGRYYTGTMLMATFISTAMFVDVTGSLPMNPEERAAWKNEGRPPYSIKIGGNWVSYRSVEPMNTFFSIAADVVRLSKMGYTDFATKVMHQSVYSIATAITDKSMLQGLIEIGEFLNPRSLKDRNIAASILDNINSLAPYSAGRRAFINAFTPAAKEITDETQRVLAMALPGYADAQYDAISWTTGQPRISLSGGFNSMTPFPVTAENTDFVTTKLSELGFDPLSVLKRGHAQIELLPREKHALGKLIYKSGVVKKIEKLMRDPEWQRVANAYKGRSFTFEEVISNDPELNPPHLQEIGRLLGQAKKEALNVILRNDSEYRMRVEQKKLEMFNIKKGNFDAPQMGAIKAYEPLRNYGR